MQTFKGAKELGSVESGSIDIKALLSLKMMEKLSAIDKGQDKIELFG